MPLNLEPLKKKSDVVTFEGTEIIVPGEVPFELMIEFYDFRTMDTEKATSSDIRMMTDMIKKILCLENDKAKVDKFFSSLYPTQVMKVCTFVSQYLAENATDKKKDSSEG